MINWDILEEPVRWDDIGEPEPGELVPILPADKPAAVVDFPAMARDAKAVLERYRPDFQALVAEAETIQVTDAASNNRAAELSISCKNLGKEIEKISKARTEKAKAFCDEIGKFAKSFTSQLSDAESILGRKLVGYKQLQEQKRREAEMLAEKARQELQRRLDAEAKEKGFEAIQVPEMVVQETTTKIVNETGSLTFRKVQKWRVIAPELIPRAYLVPDEKGITQAQKAGLLIPGIEYYDEEIPVRR